MTDPILLYEAAESLIRYVNKLEMEAPFSEREREEREYHEGPHVEFYYPYGPSVEIHIANAYEVREELKRLGYRFEPATKTWFKMIGWKRLVLEELDKLAGIGVKVGVGCIEWPLTPTYRRILEALASKAREVAEEIGAPLEEVLREYAYRTTTSSVEMPGKWHAYHAEAFILYLKKAGIL